MILLTTPFGVRKADSDQYAAMVEAIRKELKFTTLKYHRLDDMLESTGLPSCKFCTYCWHGKK